jgi:hypothetical protein
MKLTDRQFNTLLNCFETKIKRERNALLKSEYKNIYKILRKEKENRKSQPKLLMLQI